MCYRGVYLQLISRTMSKNPLRFTLKYQMQPKAHVKFQKFFTQRKHCGPFPSNDYMIYSFNRHKTAIYPLAKISVSMADT